MGRRTSSSTPQGAEAENIGEAEMFRMGSDKPSLPTRRRTWLW